MGSNRTAWLAATAFSAMTMMSGARADDREAAKRREFVPTARAATNCVVANLKPRRAPASDDAIKTAMSTCDGAVRAMVRAHDSIYGAGTGAQFLAGPYREDLPNAIAKRLAVSATCPAPLKQEPFATLGKEVSIAQRDAIVGGRHVDADALVPDFARRLSRELRGPRILIPLGPPPDWIASFGSDALQTCFPALAESRDLLAKAAAEELAAAEQRAREIAAREDARREEERRREEAKSKPDYVLGNVYVYYAYVRQCYLVRDGYVSIYISETELERGREAMKGIEAAMKKDYPNLDYDGLWQRANVRAASISADRMNCQDALDRLVKTHMKLDPGTAVPPKDF